MVQSLFGKKRYGKSFKIQVSSDAKNWKDVYETADGHTGTQLITFDEVKGRYVRMLGLQRGSGWRVFAMGI